MITKCSNVVQCKSEYKGFTTVLPWSVDRSIIVYLSYIEQGIIEIRLKMLFSEEANRTDDIRHILQICSLFILYLYCICEGKHLYHCRKCIRSTNLIKCRHSNFCMSVSIFWKPLNMLFDLFLNTAMFCFFVCVSTKCVGNFYLFIYG